MLAAGTNASNEVLIGEDLAVSAIEHRMHGLLWDWTKEASHGLDREVADRLGPPVLAARRRSIRLATAAGDVTSELSRVGVEVAVFKGIAAEGRWYSRPGARPAFDLDLWLSPNQLDHAKRAIEVLQPDHPLIEDVTHLVATRRIRSVDIVWRGVPIDLHFDPFKFGVWHDNLEAIWTDIEDTEEGYRVMGSAAEMLNALIHLNKDRFSRLLGFVDVVRASTQPGLSADAWDLAKEIGVSVPVACSARVVAEVLGVPVPIPAPPRGWRSSAWERLWPPDTRLLGEEGYRRLRHRQDWLPLLCDGKSRSALGFLRHVWFPPRPMLDYFNPHVAGLPYPLALWRARTARR